MIKTIQAPNPIMLEEKIKSFEANGRVKFLSTLDHPQGLTILVAFTPFKKSKKE